MSETGRIPYDGNGRLKKNVGRMLWECSPLCKCDFVNYSQRPRRLGLTIKRFPAKGWGVALSQQAPIPAQVFVTTYAGQLITIQEAERREERDRGSGRLNYIFDLDYTDSEGKVKYAIDASRFGNESRFFNHSCDPNLSVKMMTSPEMEHKDGVMTLSFWANRRIVPGEELTFDYTGTFVLI
ncbi:hypothetical protein BGX23_001076 [Mortierella sp. AD031]|nr:hypothetical protein BGX23_001076 [Mortierella sp. AD031]